MNTCLVIENPDDIEATIKITMTLREWEELRMQFLKKFPTLRLAMAITDLLAQSQKTFYTVNADKQ